MIAMPSERPKMIIIDQDLAIEIAIRHVFLITCHRYCIWHTLNKFYEKLGARNCSQYYESFRECIWDSEGPEEFECRWAALIERSELYKNGWLQAMFNKQDRWVPIFVKHVFSTKMSSSQRAESNHSFSKKYMDKRNSLVDFIIRFNRALTRQRYGELQADHVDHNERPMLKTHVALEKQMAYIYTCSMFENFQDEL
ncbi:hypothetical protein L1049_025139 [Liquidambar formosana]|uniref:Protein FAR1-RELATED SEQUENCE n=1 Tax=Liquidambar formosana TaxID=63359 RepID=A0AAP0X0A8_LIQFO